MREKPRESDSEGPHIHCRAVTGSHDMGGMVDGGRREVLNENGGSGTGTQTKDTVVGSIASVPPNLLVAADHLSFIEMKQWPCFALNLPLRRNLVFEPPPGRQCTPSSAH